MFIVVQCRNDILNTSWRREKCVLQSAIIYPFHNLPVLSSKYHINKGQKKINSARPISFKTSSNTVCGALVPSLEECSVTQFPIWLFATECRPRFSPLYLHASATSDKRKSFCC